jgi:hypothetical protein
MSRNMSEANKLLFLRLSECAPEQLRPNIDASIGRWIKTSDDEKEFIKHSTLNSSDLGGGRHGALVSSERLNKLWAVLPDKLDVLSLSEQIRGAEAINLDAGWLTVLGSQTWFPIREEHGVREQIVEVLGSRDGEYNHDEIISFFEDYHIIDISSLPRFDDTSYLLSRVAAASVLVSNSYSLAFDVVAARTLLDIVERDVSSLFSASIYRSITASHWVHAYLELYRCIEYFYPVPYVNDLAKRVGVTSPEELYDCLADVLGWRPYEEDALARILNMVEKASLEALAANLGMGTQEEMAGDSLCRRVAKQIYKLRNSIAHHRIGLEGPPGMVWPHLIRDLCSIVNELQRIYPDGKSPALL